MSTETPIEAAPAPVIEIEKLRGLSRMLADRAIGVLTAEVGVKAEAFAKCFWSRTQEERQLVLSTVGRWVRVDKDPKEPGQFLVRIEILELLKLMEDQAVAIDKSSRILKAFKDFLDRAESIADDIDQLRGAVEQG